MIPHLGHSPDALGDPFAAILVGLVNHIQGLHVCGLDQS